MRILVAGATGVIGSRLVPKLREAGHEVIGMTRSAARADALRLDDVEAVVCDALDAADVSRAVVEAKPEVVVHQLTSIPKVIRPKRIVQDFAENDRLRVEGTANLVHGARAAGARRVIAQSVAFAYAPVGGPVKSEEDPLYLDAPPPFDRLMGAVASLERTVTGSPDVEGVVLRYGFFYGPGSAYAADGFVADLVRRRRFPIVGDGSGIYPFIHVDDAASATVAAIAGPPGIYNVVDDEPAPVRDWLPVYARALGARPPLRVPVFLARLGGGDYAVFGMTRQRGGSNRKARRELGWEPAFPTWRTGFAEALG
jgi:nucleoside-diphosphate-sugar epimerase